MTVYISVGSEIGFLGAVGAVQDADVLPETYNPYEDV